MQTLADGKALLREVVQRCQEEHTRVNLDYSFEFCNGKFNSTRANEILCDRIKVRFLVAGNHFVVLVAKTRSTWYLRLNVCK